MKFSEFKQDPKGEVSRWVQTTLVKSGMPVAQVAGYLGKGEDLVYKWANPQATEQNIHLWAAAEIMALTEDFTILKELADMFAFALIPINGEAVAAFKALTEALEKAGK
jgi:hypothetical protein